MDKQDLSHRIQVAMGEKEADLVLRGGKIVSTFSEEVFEADIAVANGMIVAIGDVGEAKKVVDLKGSYVCPSFIDSHIHIESSMLSPEGFAEVAVPCGTGTVVSDPHEIANVCGIEGVNYMIQAAKKIPLDIRYTIPSCVPATNMETSGAKLSPADVNKIYDLDPTTPALSELMNYPGVYFRDEEVLEKVCRAHKLGLRIDGHSPMLRGKHLNAYLNARIFTDHECTSAKEATEKLRKGMFIAMREGSAARNLDNLLPILSDQTAHRVCIASDDRHPDQILESGYLDRIWRKMIQAGVEPIRALRIMTLNPALFYGLNDRGGIGVGYRADFFTTPSLTEPKIESVYYLGELVADKGKFIPKIPREDSTPFTNSVHLPEDLESKLQKYPTSGQVHVIELIEGELVSQKATGDAQDVTNSEKDVAYLAVVERHGKNGQVGLGFISGLGIQKGALASTVAHDNHNLILVGKSIEDMLAAAKATKEVGGGLVAVQDEKVTASVPLAISGLMSQNSGEEVAKEIIELDKATHGLGIKVEAPFMALSFLALSVIPHLKLTDMGLVDVDKFQLIPLEIKN